MVGSAELVANQDGAYNNLNEPQPTWNRRSHIIAITVAVQVPSLSRPEQRRENMY